MTTADTLQLAFVLHTRPWRETSLIIDVFTEQHGKMGLVAKGVRAKRSPKRSLLQPLTPLLICWKGRGELPTLTTVEHQAASISLKGNSLYSALYINELVVRLIHRHDPHPNLFHYYHSTLNQLLDPEKIEQTLRVFELNLLNEIGYGINLHSDEYGDKIRPEQNYTLNADGAFQQVLENCTNESTSSYNGSHLTEIAEQNWQQKTVLVTAKKLLRLSLQRHLGNKPLQSRKLFRSKS